MEVSAVTGGGSTEKTSSLTQANNASLDYDAFLNLLVAELKNQDPTEPMKSSDYVAQLATFSGVEQAIQTNTKLDSLLSSTALAQIDGLIGRNLSSADGSVSGKIEAVRVTNSGAVAVLTNGKEVVMGPGITVS